MKRIDFEMLETTSIDGELLYHIKGEQIIFILIEKYNGDKETIKEVLFNVNNILIGDNIQNYYFYINMLNNKYDVIVVDPTEK